MGHSKGSKHHHKMSEKDKQVKKNAASIDDFTVLKLLGRGAQGNVYMVEKNNGPDKGMTYAMKVYEREEVMKGEFFINTTKIERRILEAVADAPFLMHMKYAFQSKAYLYIILDLAQGGDLFSMLQNRNPNKEEMRLYLAEILLALEKLHKKNFVYRDLKLENILLDGDGHIVITDFGLSFDNADEVGERFLGTPNYMGPECVDETLNYTFALDMYAFGVLAHELIARKNPHDTFFSDDQDEAAEQLKHSKIKIDDSLDEELKDLLSKLLVKEPEKRLNCKEVKSHTFFEGIDWKALSEKRIEPQFKPNFSDKYDTQNFDDTYTEQTATFIDDSRKAYKSETFPDFNFTAPDLLNASILVDRKRHHKDDKEKSTKRLKADDENSRKLTEKKQQVEIQQSKKVEKISTKKTEEIPAKREATVNRNNANNKQPRLNVKRKQPEPVDIIEVLFKNPLMLSKGYKIPMKKTDNTKTNENSASTSHTKIKKEPMDTEKQRRYDDKKDVKDKNREQFERKKRDEKVIPKSEKSMDKKDSHKMPDDKINHLKRRLEEKAQESQPKRAKFLEIADLPKHKTHEEKVAMKKSQKAQESQPKHVKYLDIAELPKHKTLAEKAAMKKSEKAKVKKENPKKADESKKIEKLTAPKKDEKKKKNHKKMPKSIRKLIMRIRTLPMCRDEIIRIGNAMKEANYIPNELRPSMIKR